MRLFRSLAHYFDPRGPISWDMAMTATAPDWRPHLNAGDTLRISATYETKRASWYEAMGIMVAWEAWDSESGGVPGSTDPFSNATDQTGHVTHGHLAENRHHGGSVFVGVKLKKFPVLHPPSHHRRVPLHPRDFTSTGPDRCTPTIRQGQSLTFVNDDSIAVGKLSSALFGSVTSQPTQDYINSIFHSVTSCQYPCGLDTGISYPLANGAGSYDSGQLGPRRRRSAG